jgi:hypothetical protein
VETTYTLHYTPAIVGRAVNRFWLRAVGWKFLIAVFVLAWFVVSAIRGGDRSWLIGALGALGGLAVLFSVALYFAHRRRSFGAFRRLEQGQALLRVNERTFALQSAAGFSELSWNAVTEIWRYEDAWLLIFSRALFATLPISDIDEQGRELIARCVKESGGKLR